MDHFSLTAASFSYHTNIRILQKAFGAIRAKARAREIDFGVPKTELMHWRTPKQRDPPGTRSPRRICLNGQIFCPLLCVSWLGYWLAADHSSSHHFTRRLTLAQAALTTVKMVLPQGTSLFLHLTHRLAIALLLLIRLYGADLLVPNRGMLEKMEIF